MAKKAKPAARKAAKRKTQRDAFLAADRKKNADVQQERKGKQQAQEQPDAPQHSLQWPLDPVEGQWTTSTLHFWQSQCGSYRVVRIKPKYADRNGERPVRYGADHKRDDCWDSCYTCPKQGRGYPLYYHSLEAAFEAAEKHYAAKNGENPESNSAAAVVKAKELGLAEKRRQPEPTAATQAGENGAVAYTPKPRKAQPGELVDAYGWREGTVNYKTNQILSKEAQTVNEMSAKVGTKVRYAWIKELVQRGVLVQEGKGYRLK